jgi:5-formyltetrahydrofolate cyclo-ligase
MNGSKKEIRDEMRQKRKDVSEDGRDEASESIVEKILARADVCAAIEKRLPFAVYLATQSELDLRELVEALWEKDVTVAVPCWNSERHTYVLGAYDNTTTLVEGDHHVLEPAEVNEINAEDIGVWIVPGLAFTRDGRRIGYGGGWYDRLLSLASKDALVLGVAYPFQIVDDLPMEAHDRQLVDIIVAEED